MRNEEYKDFKKEGNHRGERYRGKGHKSHQRGAKTFRRGRAIAFLEILNLKRSTLKKQLETPELQSINPILVGELKAIDTVINEFVQLFELHEIEEMEIDEKKNEGSETCKESLTDGEKVDEEDEKN
ncbi:hypothetical protein [Metabacillus rhizolycopersici]|uniref:Uncharacterized protein n=1 Tax=Metabacillus rhizolycopersici TaxID=2875709 RepID=A0ABS7V0W9_9BACI|nr:hypothetical protein [Metabacillus rhizolycopersici]MBZ5753820.1 hypothetical protein [Metabacillus rhizolycopersici]